jgi:hypothetical protein
MKKIWDIHRRCLWLCLPILACQILPDTVQASTKVRIPLLEAADLRMEDRGHLALKCSYVPGSQIFTRSLPERTLTVTAAYDRKLLVPSPPPAEPRTSGGLLPPLLDALRQGT